MELELKNNETENNERIRFLSIDDVASLLGWSKKTVQKLFNDPKFPMTDYGKGKRVLEPAFIEYFSVRREKSKDRYWRTK